MFMDPRSPYGARRPIRSRDRKRNRTRVRAENRGLLRDLNRLRRRPGRVRRVSRRGERGQVVPLLAVLLVLAGLVGMGLVHLAGAASDRARAKAVADATALAGAGGGRDAAQEVAGANAAELDHYRTDGFDVIVVVTLDGHTATARARWSPEVVGEALSDPTTP